MLRPGGRLVIVDLAPHENAEALQRLAHRWPGFSDAAMRGLLTDAGLRPGHPGAGPAALDVRLWPAERLPADAKTTELSLVTAQ